MELEQTSIPRMPRILIVDDEYPLMMALCHTLGDLGFDTTGFNSPEDALHALNGQEFELILSDLMMPNIDGITFVQEALKKDPDLACVIMTGQGTIETAVDAMKAGALDYILKPFKASDALPVLKRALEVRRLRTEVSKLNGQLREHAKELEARNEELSLFSAAVCHDLRGPLNRISGFTSIIEHTCGELLNEEAVEAMRFVQTSVSDMRNLISGLYDLALVKDIDPIAIRVDLSALAKKTADTLLKDSDRDVRIEIESGLSTVADVRLMSIVLTNLIDNSLKFTSRVDNAVVTVGQDHSVSEKPFFVKDNGAGFDQSKVERIFKPFKRLHSTSEYAGSGIGLNTVERVVNRSGGKVWALSEPGNGATFFFTIGKTPGN